MDFYSAEWGNGIYIYIYMLYIGKGMAELRISWDLCVGTGGAPEPNWINECIVYPNCDSALHLRQTLNALVIHSGKRAQFARSRCDALLDLNGVNWKTSMNGKRYGKSKSESIPLWHSMQICTATRKQWIMVGWLGWRTENDGTKDGRTGRSDSQAGRQNGIG